MSDGSWLKVAGVALVILLIAAAIAGWPMWIPFALVGIVLLLILFFGSRR